MNYQNHVIDPTFFYDAIEEFAFDYDLYVVHQNGVDEYGRQKLTYEKQTIRGSLQSQGKQISRSKDGNTYNWRYEFYCKSLYRINDGDIIEYKNNFFICKNVYDFDEYGVRHVSLETIKLSAYRDFAEYLKYLRGEKLV